MFTNFYILNFKNYIVFRNPLTVSEMCLGNKNAHEMEIKKLASWRQ